MLHGQANWRSPRRISVHREGDKQDGVLARVTGEIMVSYVSRRRRWHRSLATLDQKFRIPEHFQLEMMMDCAGITDHMQQKPVTLQTMDPALIQEYPVLHERGSVAAVSDRITHDDHHRIDPSGRFQAG